MFTYELQKTVCTFYDCVFMHTIFFYEPSAKFHINETVYNEKLNLAAIGYSNHMENYITKYFSSYEEGFKMIESVKENIISSKKYLIPGYLSATAKSCVKQLLDSPFRKDYDFVGFINGILIWMPDESLRKEVYNIARQKGFIIA